MRRLHGIILCSITAMLLSGGVSTLTPAAEAAPTPPKGCPVTGVTEKSTVIATQPDVRQAYFKNDRRLGPNDLPKPKDGPPLGAIGVLVDKYNRDRQMGPKNFIDCYWRVNVIPPGGGAPVTGWSYPPAHGFVTDSEGNPIKERVPVPAGKKLELFGNSDTGQFLAPGGTPYEQLAIPPSNLDTFTNAFPFNYHLYLVCQTFQADEGRIAPWFQQPGGGTQDYLFNTTIGQLTTDHVVKDITSSPDTTTC